MSIDSIRLGQIWRRIKDDIATINRVNPFKIITIQWSNGEIEAISPPGETWTSSKLEDTLLEVLHALEVAHNGLSEAQEYGLSAGQNGIQNALSLVRVAEEIAKEAVQVYEDEGHFEA